MSAFEKLKFSSRENIYLVKIFTLKWGKDNERATSSFRYISEAIKKVLINSPCMCVYVI